MADYCSNRITFTGDNRQEALQYFSGLGYDSPPFYDLITNDEAVYFESRWVSPLRDLNQIAEQFNVSYDLVYQLPNERTKEKYHYACLQDEQLNEHAALLRTQINDTCTATELNKQESRVHEQAEKGLFNNHERSILTQLLGKKYIALSKVERPWEDDGPDRGNQIGR
ncbi:MAG: hypothetical protein V4546_05375 [Bacteroidota bacterium]